MGWTVYILRCADGRLYTGITNDMARRKKMHEKGTGAKFTRGRGPLEIIYTEEYSTRSDALKRETAIKALKREQKMALVSV